MREQSILLFSIFIPVIGSFALPALGKFSAGLRNTVALALVGCSFVLSALLLGPATSTEGTVYSHLLPLGFNLVLKADALAVFVAVVSSFISLLILIFSFSYVSHYENQNEYYFMVVLFVGSMVGLVYSANLIFLYVFWEITALSSWRLIGFFRQPAQVERANKAFLVTVGGSLAMLLGFLILRQQAGSFDLAALQHLSTSPWTVAAVVLVLMGILSKSATLPFHTWLPDAGVAPSPVTALLHAAVLVKIGVYVFARLFVATAPIPHAWNVAVLYLAGISSLVAGGAALIETDLKRIIAYSTISQIGFIFGGLATGTAIGIAGGILFILMHGLAKAGLFLAAGVVEQNTKTKDITRLGGLFRTMPVTAVSFLLCAFSVMGIPPFGGFFSKYMVMAGMLEAGTIGAAALFLVSAAFTVLYLFRTFNLVFLGETRIEAPEKSASMVSTIAVLALLSLAGGFLIQYPNGFLQAALTQMAGVR